MNATLKVSHTIRHDSLVEGLLSAFDNAQATVEWLQGRNIDLAESDLESEFGRQLITLRDDLSLALRHTERLIDLVPAAK